MVAIAERILLALSRAPDGMDYPRGEAEDADTQPLRLLRRVYPQLEALVAGRRVADFGCGVGSQSIALATEYGCQVVGIDSNRTTLARAIDKANKQDLPPGRLAFVTASTPDLRGSFDVVISQNSFEHFPEPQAVLGEMCSLLNDSGVLLITFGPPWYAPYGSHMHFFCRVPWVNLLFPESVVMRARSHFRNDGATTYGEVESGLNKMTIRKFTSLVSSCDLTVTYSRFDCVRGMDWLSGVPILRELFINHVTVVLSRMS